MRATNHHGRGTARHVSRKGFDAPHIDRAKAKDNIYWTWDSKASHDAPDVEMSELRYYRQSYQPGLDEQNSKHKVRRQYARIRTIEDVYHARNTQPEESLLYIGNRDNLTDVSTGALWRCVADYVNWEKAYSKAHGDFYKPLSLALHADEQGQIHVHERGVYQHKDDAGNWQIGQARALEAAGIPLPHPSKPRDKYNNRKQSWDAVRRKKWIDIVESYGFAIEREPEASRPHLPLEAWQALQEQTAEIDIERRQMTAEADKISKMRQAVDKERTVLNSRRQALEQWEQELDEQETALEALKTSLESREAVLTELGRERYQRALQERQRAQEAERIRLADTISPAKSPKRAGKHPSADREY